MAIRLSKILPFYLFILRCGGSEIKIKKWITFDNLYKMIESRSFVSSGERIFVLRSEL